MRLAHSEIMRILMTMRERQNRPMPDHRIRLAPPSLELSAALV